MWIITTERFGDKETVYLGWQDPAWDDDGYFWTSKEVIKKIIKNNTPEHPFLFDTKTKAIKHLKNLHIPQICRVVQIRL